MPLGKNQPGVVMRLRAFDENKPSYRIDLVNCMKIGPTGLSNQLSLDGRSKTESKRKLA